MSKQFNIHSANATAAREVYENSGIKVLSTFGAGLRHITPQERVNLAADPRSLEVEHGDLVRDPQLYQLRADVRGSNLIVLRVSARVYGELDRSRGEQGTCSPGFCNAALWQGIREAVLSAPAIRSAKGDYCHVLFTAPADLPGNACRRLYYDDLISLETIKADPIELSNQLPLPHAGTFEKWARLGGSMPAAPEVLVAIAKQSGEDAETIVPAVAIWLSEHFTAVRRGLVARAKGSPVVGLPRDEVYNLLLRANHWTPNDFSLEQLSAAGDLAETAFGKFRHRVKAGYIWELKRNDKPLASLAGVPLETIDPVLLSAFKSFQLGLESHPDRVRARKLQAQIDEAARVREEHIRAHYGTAEVAAWVQAEGYMPYHAAAEVRRIARGGPYGRPASPLPWAMCCPDWWKEGPGLKPEDRYESIIKRLVEGKEVAA